MPICNSRPFQQREEGSSIVAFNENCENFHETSLTPLLNIGFTGLMGGSTLHRHGCVSAAGAELTLLMRCSGSCRSTTPGVCYEEDLDILYMLCWLSPIPSHYFFDGSSVVWRSVLDMQPCSGPATGTRCPGATSNLCGPDRSGHWDKDTWHGSLWQLALFLVDCQLHR